MNRKITFGSFWLVTLAISFYWGFVARDPFDSIQRKVIEDTFIREMDGNDLDELMEEIAGIKTDRVETASSSLVTEETNEQAIELNFQHLDLETMMK